MKPTTFGRTAAARELVGIIGQLPVTHRAKIRSKVSETLRHYRRGLKYIHAIDKDKDNDVRVTMLQLWRIDVLQRINEMDLPNEVKNFMRNVVIGGFRGTINEK